MSLRSDLKDAGIANEQLGIIEAVVRQYISGDYVPKTRFDEVNDEKKALSEQLKSFQEAATKAEERATSAEQSVLDLSEQLQKTETDWNTRYTELEETHRREAEDRLILDTYTSKVSAIKDYVKDSTHDVDMLISLIDFDALDYSDGKVSGVDKAIESLKKEKAFLFKQDAPVESTAPTSGPKSGGMEIDFGATLAKKAAESDALTKAATEKYFK